MPNRIIKESIRTSYEINDLSIEAEVTFYRLLTFADDYGRFPSDPRVLQASLFPLRPDIRSKDFTRWVAELVSAGLVRLYITSDLKPFGFFVKWDKHQNKRAKSSKYPEPVGEAYASIGEQLQAIDIKKKHVISHDIICNHMLADVPVLDTRTRTRNSKLDTRVRETRAREGPDPPDDDYKPPTIDQVLQYAGVHAIPEKVAKEFFWHYDAIGWENTQGRPIKNWTSLLNKWNSKEPQFKNKSQKGHAGNPDAEKIRSQLERLDYDDTQNVPGNIPEWGQYGQADL